jgi:putative transposase
MIRFHVHVTTRDLPESVATYSRIFGPPAVEKPDYAKWEPAALPVVFALSTRKAVAGIDHLGIKADSEEELASMRAGLKARELAHVEQRDAECCYVRADKLWVTDPNGIPWELYAGKVSLPLTPSVSSALKFRPARSMMTGMITLILTGLLRVLRTRRALVLENLALRHQLTVLQRTAPRPRLRTSDRLLWVLLSRLWAGWRDAISVVQPATVIRWQRTGFQLLWAWKSRRTGPGRPAVAPEIRALIRQMSRANPLWGAPRIHGELQKLGLEISQAAVSKYLGRRSKPPSQTWRTFLDNHLQALVSVDFFVVPTVMFKVLFVFVVLAHERRCVVHVNVTDAPTAQWTAQQLVEAFPWDTAPRYLLRDRDAVYGAVFSGRVRSLGIHEGKIAPQSPWQNPYVERLIGTLRRECLDHVVVLNETHLRRLLREYLIYYHGARTHLSLAKDTPEPRPMERQDEGRIVETPMVGGLHHRYTRRAA